MLRIYLTLGSLLHGSSTIPTESIPSFRNEIIPILTRQGCNQGACHGKGAGQNGFRLSLRGYAPEADHRSLTREFVGRRIASQPEASLLLLKATGKAPHEGGRLFGSDSREYQTLLAWLRAGMPGLKPDEPTIRKLSVEPTSQVLSIGENTQLRAWADFSDGSRRDVTWLTKFESNDAGQLAVTPEGRVRAVRAGETAVRAAYLTEVAVAQFTTPMTQPVDAKRFAAGDHPIDRAVFAKLQALRIEPSDLCSDTEFIRRVYLDALGVLPTPQEVRDFLADRRADRRARWIDELLNRPEYVDYRTLQLSDLFQNRKERDHDVRGSKGVRDFHAWLRGQVEANRPWDQLARAVLTASGSAREGGSPAVGYFIVTVGEHREAYRSEVVASVAQAFLGTRIGCAQCHNHPLERYTQDDYYHFAGFFSRLRLERKDPKVGVTSLRVGPTNPNDRRPPGVTQPRTGAFLTPQPLDRTAVTVGDDPRQALADWMTHPSNEFFAAAMVNRIWRHYLGVGLVEPVDDLRATNPPSNPELWNLLKAEFIRSGYDMRHLTRFILTSRTYQLSSATRPSNAADAKFYSHYYARRLPAEVLGDAIAQVTGVPDRFPGYPVGIRAVQLPDPTLKSYFLTLFGRSERVTACACERSGEVTMPQLLHLQNGEMLSQKLRANDGVFGRLLKEISDETKLTTELFLRTLSRPPTETELTTVRKLLSTGEPREEVYRDLLWALVNAKDFAFNR